MKESPRHRATYAPPDPVEVRAMSSPVRRFLVLATLLALADLGARLAGGIPVGIVTALIGAPFFIWLLRRSRAVRPVVSA